MCSYHLIFEDVRIIGILPKSLWIECAIFREDPCSGGVMKKLQQVQNNPAPTTSPVAQGGGGAKSNATLAQQLQTLTRENAVAGPKVPTLDVEQVRGLCPNPQEITVPVPDSTVVASVGLSDQNIAVPIPNSIGSGTDSGSEQGPKIPNVTVPVSDQNIAVPIPNSIGSETDSGSGQGPKIPNVTVPVSDIPKVGMVPQPVTVPIPDMTVHTRPPVQNQNETSPSPGFGGPSSGGGGGKGGGGIVHKVYHDFNNHDNKDISLTFTGGVQSVTAESKAAPDGLYSTGLDAKHYTVTFFNDVNHIQVLAGDDAAAGAIDAGITVAKVQKVAPKQFKVWFNRSKGANTYVDNFTIEGI